MYILFLLLHFVVYVCVRVCCTVCIKQPRIFLIYLFLKNLPEQNVFFLCCSVIAYTYIYKAEKGSKKKFEILQIGV